jgi:hypothetical protein
LRRYYVTQTCKNHHIRPMIRQLQTFHVAKFLFDSDAAYFQRNKWDNTLAREWEDMWYGCSTGQCDGNELDVLWCAWMMPLYES